MEVLQRKRPGGALRGPGYKSTLWIARSARASGCQPALQDGLILWINVQEDDTRSHIGRGINDFCVGFERFLAGRYSQSNHCPRRKRVHHIEIAAAEAKLAHSRDHAHLRGVLTQFGMSDEGNSRRAATLLFHAAPLVGCPASLIV